MSCLGAQASFIDLQMGGGFVHADKSWDRSLYAFCSDGFAVVMSGTRFRFKRRSKPSTVVQCPNDMYCTQATRASPAICPAPDHQCLASEQVCSAPPLRPRTSSLLPASARAAAQASPASPSAASSSSHCSLTPSSVGLPAQPGVAAAPCMPRCICPSVCVHDGALKESSVYVLGPQELTVSTRDAASIPPYAVGPALITVGSMMIANIVKVCPSSVISHHAHLRTTDLGCVWLPAIPCMHNAQFEQ